jgi:hypothetical protein
MADALLGPRASYIPPNPCSPGTAGKKPAAIEAVVAISVVLVLLLAYVYYTRDDKHSADGFVPYAPPPCHWGEVPSGVFSRPGSTYPLVNYPRGGPNPCPAGCGW